MKKRIFKFSFVFGIMILCTACEKDWYQKLNYYVVNETDEEYLVCLDFDEGDIQKDRICSVLNNTSSQIVDSYTIIHNHKTTGYWIFNCWIYNRKDSMFYKLDSEELVGLNKVFGKIEVNETNQINPMNIIDFYIYINDTMVSKMTKNTHLTDSIFGLK